MKLGTQTNSLVNHVLSRAVVGQPRPEVGQGATLLGWTDRNPATIIKVNEINTGWDVTVQADNYRRIDSNGLSECQDYEYSRNPNGATSMFRFESKKADKGWREIYMRPNGRYCLIGGGLGLRIGERQKYHDFSF